MRQALFMVRLFLADLPDILAITAARVLPRNVVYWAAIRLIAHAGYTLPTKVMSELTPADCLKAWRQQ